MAAGPGSVRGEGGHRAAGARSRCRTAPAPLPGADPQRGAQGEGTQDTETLGLEVPLPGQPRRFPPRSRSQHRVAGSPAPSMTSPAGLLSVVPSRAPGFSQPIQPGCGEMRLCSSPGAGTRQHPPPRPCGVLEKGMLQGDPIPEGTHFPKGHIPQEDPLSHHHSTTCAEFSVSKALEKIRDPIKLRISNNWGSQLLASPTPILPRAPPALLIHTIRHSRWNTRQGGHGT